MARADMGFLHARTIHDGMILLMLPREQRLDDCGVL